VVRGEGQGAKGEGQGARRRRDEGGSGGRGRGEGGRGGVEGRKTPIKERRAIVERISLINATNTRTSSASAILAGGGALRKQAF